MKNRETSLKHDEKEKKTMFIMMSNSFFTLFHNFEKVFFNNEKICSSC